MHGIVSLLPQPYYGEVEKLWDQLENNFGLSGIQVTPFPHFSWQIGEVYDETMLRENLERLSGQSNPFTVRTTGLGVFSGVQPVIFIAVVKSPQLIDFHRRVWQSLESTGSGISPYYNPDNWVPHISLAYADVTQENIGQVMESLAFQTFNWTFEVNNFVYIHEPDGEIGKIRFRTDFQTELPAK